jgi:hypothetical protein
VNFFALLHWHIFSLHYTETLMRDTMENKDAINRNKRYNHEGIGTITALLTIIALSIIFVSVFSMV